MFNTFVEMTVAKGETVLCLVEAHALHRRERDAKDGSWKKGDIYYNGELVLRVDPRELTPRGEKFFKQFNCLNPNGVNSRLYIVSKEIVRKNVEGETSKGSPKRIGRK